MEIGPIRLADLVVFVTLVGGTIAVVRTINRWMNRITHLWEDFIGEEGRPGVPGRKGVMERLSEHDDALAETQRGLRQHLRDHHQQHDEQPSGAILPLPNEDKHELEGE